MVKYFQFLLICELDFDETDEEILPIKKEPKSCSCISYREQDSIIWRWSKFEHTSRGDAITSATKIKLQASIKSLCPRENGKAQVLQDNWLSTYSSSPEDERRNFTKELYLQLIMELSKLVKFWSFFSNLDCQQSELIAIGVSIFCPHYLPTFSLE